MGKKVKKRLGTYDLYRFIVTGKQDRIKGIEYFDCNNDATLVVVRYDGDDLPLNRTKTYLVDSINKGVEKNGIQRIVRLINKQLGNCEKPGKKHKENYKFKVGDIVKYKDDTQYIVVSIHQTYFEARKIVDGLPSILYSPLKYTDFVKVGE